MCFDEEVKLGVNLTANQLERHLISNRIKLDNFDLRINKNTGAYLVGCQGNIDRYIVNRNRPQVFTVVKEVKSIITGEIIGWTIADNRFNEYNIPSKHGSVGNNTEFSNARAVYDKYGVLKLVPLRSGMRFKEVKVDMQ